MKIILASASPCRRDILRQVGIEPVIVPSDIDENIDETDPAEKVKKLSMLKAEAVAELLPMRPFPAAGDDMTRSACECDIILAADTVVTIDGEILGKPKSHEEAYHMISRLQGRAHSVFTGVSLLLPGRKPDTFAVETRVSVRPMTEEEIRAYSDSAEPMDKAGAYGIQGAFAAYISSIVRDYYNVVGLPICEVMKRLRPFAGMNRPQKHTTH